MAAYVIVTYDIADPKGFEPYIPGVMPLLQKHGAEVLVADREAQALEGKASGVTVILKFSSQEAALAFYNDPAYQPVKKIRLDTTKNGTALLTREFTPPTA